MILHIGFEPAQESKEAGDDIFNCRLAESTNGDSAQPISSCLDP